MARTTTTRARKSRKSGETELDDERSPTRDIWKGAISFGLVEIPVALVSSEKPGGFSLTYLDRRDFSPVGYRRYNKNTEKEVPWSEIVRGYEYAKGEYVVLGKHDLERANPALTQTINIEQFVDASEIELIYFEKPYYLEPLKANSKSYALLRETLRKTGKVGIARVAVRTREHVAAVGVRDQALVLYLLRFAHEVRPPTALDNVSSGRGPAVSAKEIQLAERLVEDLTSDWEPEAYKDDYANDVKKLVRKKIEAGEVHSLDDKPLERPKSRGGEVVDLMPLLRKSVEAARAGGTRRKVSKKKAARRRTA